MRVVTTSVTVLTFDELSPEIQDKAVAGLREKLSGPWWDQNDNDDIAATMLMAFAATVKAPGWNIYGCWDFPGIDGVSIDGWDLDRGESLTLRGTLTRDNAPRLPWRDGLDTVLLHHPDYCDAVYVQTDEPATDEQRDALAQAVKDAIRTALRAGRDEMEYKCGDEYARERAEDMEFTEDGALYPSGR